MRVFTTVVEPLADDLTSGVTNLSHGSTVGAKAICDDRLGASVSFHRPLQECHCRLPIAFSCHEHLQDFAFVIDGAPEIVQITIDANEDLIKVPSPLWVRTQGSRPLLTDQTGEAWAEPVPPDPDGLMAHVNAALMQQILDLSQRKRKSDVHHHRDTDDFR